jgi:hypothetical protein
MGRRGSSIERTVGTCKPVTDNRAQFARLFGPPAVSDVSKAGSKRSLRPDLQIIQT